MHVTISTQKIIPPKRANQATKPIKSRSTTAYPSQGLKANGNSNGVTNVLLVNKRKAKDLKVALEKDNFLDRSYRMVKADPAIVTCEDPASYISVPVSLECFTIVSKADGDASSEYPWINLVDGSGRQSVPFSSVILGRK